MNSKASILSVLLAIASLIIFLFAISACAGHDGTGRVQVTKCAFEKDTGLDHALDVGINFSVENVSNTIFKVFDNIYIDNIIIKGAFVYFTRNHGSANDLYRIDLVTGKIERLMADIKVGGKRSHASVYNPSIYGSYLVFNDVSGSPGPSMTREKSRIFICDLETKGKQVISKGDIALFEPWIWGSKIIFKEGSEFSHALKLYDIASKDGRYLWFSGDRIKNQKIYENFVTFESFKDGSSYVSYYNLDKDTGASMPYDKSSASMVKQEHPSIYGKNIVFADNRAGNWDIYLFDLETEQLKQITSNSADQKNPEIYQNIIVWEDYRNKNSDIYLYYLENETEILISNTTYDEWDPAIFGSIAAWKGKDRRIDSNELYVYVIPELSYYHGLQANSTG